MRAVFDVGILVSALISPHGVCAQLLRLRREGRFVLVASPAVFAEARRVLAREKFRRYVSAEVAEFYVASFESTAELQEDPRDVTAITPDPKDDYLLALAVAAGADVLVSGDSHLTDLTEAPVPIRTPRQFLDQLES